MNPLRLFRRRWFRVSVVSLAALVGIAVVGLAAWGLPAPPAMRVEDGPRVSWKWVWRNIPVVRRIQAARRFAGWLPGQGGILVHVGTPGAVHVAQAPGAELRRLEGLPERARYLVQSPIAERPYFVFSLDEGGSERYVQYRFDLESGTYQALTPIAARSYVGGFDGGGRRVLYASARRNRKDLDLYVVDVLDPTSDALVFQADGQFSAEAFSPDGRTALVARITSAVSSRPYLLDLETRRLRPLFSEVDPAPGLVDAGWSRDGRTLYLGADLDRDFIGVHAIDLESGRATVLTPDLRWDVDAIELLPDDRTLAVLVNEDARAVLYLLDTTTGRLTRANGPQAGSIVRIVAHPRAPLVALDVVSPAGVSGVWVYDVTTDRTTAWAVSGAGSTDLPEPSIVRYPTFDAADGARRMIPAVIFPPASGFSGRQPVMIDLHGGPAMQARLVPLPHYEMVRRLGVTVIAPNVRGSRGYGRAYAALDDREHREDAVRDVGALLDWIAAQPLLDPARVVISGGSYGGYMTLASLVHYSDRIRCGFELFGISDFITFLEASEDSHFPDAQRAEYGDERDPGARAFLESISPARRADRIRVPLLIFQGSNDVRVKPQESRQMAARIRAAGGTVTYAEAANEGHGLQHPLNQLYVGALASEFMERCVAR